MMTRLPLQSPDITDRMPIAVRAYAKRKVEKPKIESPIGQQKPKRKSSSLPASPWVIVFDTETTTKPSQALRFGTYQVRKHRDLHEAGIFYHPPGISEFEKETLLKYAESNELKLITRDQFADRIFYGIGYAYRARFVGFNLPFDISRIAIGHNSARGTDMRGGFTFKISNDKRNPNLQVKHGQKFSFMRFAAPMGQPDNRSDRRRKRRNPVQRGHFLDINTLAMAMFSKPYDLQYLSQVLKVEHPKLHFKEFSGPITKEMVEYAVRDTQTTWECYVELVKRYEHLGIPNTPPEKIYSEASIGKGYLRGTNLQPWQKCQPDFPDQLLANIMATYLGGRSEIRIRREIREVMLCDFLSMYPTVCTLMKLWDFVIAKGMTWADTTSQTQAWLEQLEVHSFKSKDIWRQLATLVRVHPDAEILPVRAAYGHGDQNTIGVNYISSTFGIWYTLADCAASKLLSGKTPEVLEAITFTPMDPQTGLLPIQISGKAAYTVHPLTDDLYKRCVELRLATKRQAKNAIGAEKEALKTEEQALKIAVNATSYGVFVEINVAEMTEDVELLVLSGTDEPFDFASRQVEETGPFFHPLLATLITGAARLMLAITEALVEDQDLDWAFCDTDSMAIAKPSEMGSELFRSKVNWIVDWFDNLNPYDADDKILKIEDVNFEYGTTDSPNPLYCWAISAKRYALFNLDGCNKPIIRKASGHGLGHLRGPYTDKNPAIGIPTSIVPVHEIGKGFKLWQHDIWWQIITAALAGHPNKVDLGFHPAFHLPAINRFGLTTPHLLNYFKTYNKDRDYDNQARPFGFMTGLTAKPFDETENLTPNLASRRPKERHPKPIAPYTKDPSEAAMTAFDRETGLPIEPSNLMTYREVLATYHMQHENKFLNGSFRNFGTTIRRHIMVTNIRHIGKEANRLEEQMVLGKDEEANPDYGMAPDQAAALVAELRGIADVLVRKTVADALGIRKGKLASVLKGTARTNIPAKALSDLRLKYEIENDTLAEQLREMLQLVEDFGLRPAAKMLGFDPSNLKRRIKR